MGYNKIIKYAKTLEVYEYERGLPDRPTTKRGVQSRIPLPYMASDGSDTLRQRESEGKRQDNATRASMVFRRLVSANLGGTDHPLLLTCTYRDNQTDVSQGYKDFSSFIKALRYKFGRIFRYIAVPEFQKRGAVHFHAMFWGLPQTVYQTERHTRLVASLWEKGYTDMIQTDGSPKLSTYLTKYMTKTFIDHRLMRQKAYTCSRNLIRPEIASLSTHSLGHLLEELGVGSPEIDKQYDTHRLGRGRHRIYKLD